MPQPFKAKKQERLKQLATKPETEMAWVCRDCGLQVAEIAGFAIPKMFVNTAKNAPCEVCGQFGSVTPSYDWAGCGID